MGVNQIQEAVKAYEQMVNAAVAECDKVMRKAESDLRAALSLTTASEPPSGDVVTMKREDYVALQSQLKKVSDFIKAHPELG